jgi:tetratricopeptide (TPR) repeat protein
LQGDTRGCIAALHRAERQFHAADDGDEPSWLSYFDEAYLSAKFGHALRHLKRLGEAERFTRRSLEMSDGYDRGRVFNTALLAGILADQAKVDEAASYATSAIKISEGMRSARVTHYLRDVYQRLSVYKTSQSVIELRRTLEMANVIRRNESPRGDRTIIAG